ncbi:MAG TPA: class I SAM-dependent methyltransferase [Streptosporangiaceae bacterium]|jgi:SAM-dependent methyltransferase
MAERDFQTQRLSFGAVADDYDRVRPSYPEAALRWIIGDAPAKVVDLGAGTGLLTRVLARLGHDVTAVEPDERMRRRCAGRSPGVPVLEGSGEAIPLPAGSVDAVVAGQAYHWFAGAAAHAEIARVLRPGGVFGPIWNLRDESVDWVARLSVLVSLEDGTAHRGGYAEVDLGEGFGPAERREFPNAQTHTADSLVALVRSRSYFLAATPSRRRRIESGVRELAAGLPPEFELPYVTRAFRARTVR